MGSMTLVVSKVESMCHFDRIEIGVGTRFDDSQSRDIFKSDWSRIPFLKNKIDEIRT